MTYSRVACVTGANKGIGFGIVRQLALQYPKSEYNDGPVLIYLTARDQKRGEQALSELRADPLLKREKSLREDGGLADIKFHKLDISSETSIEDFKNFLAREHAAGIDIVVNNAAVALNGFDSQVVHDTLACNYYGTVAATKAFLPLIRPGGRLVNVSSVSGKLRQFSPAIAARLRKAQTVDDVTSVMQDFQQAVDNGREKEAGFPSAAYATSKAGLTAVTRVFAEEEVRGGKGILVNSCHPGYVNTDMTKGRGIKTIDDGAKTPVLLAIGDIGKRTGLYWSDEKPDEP